MEVRSTGGGCAVRNGILGRVRALFGLESAPLWAHAVIVLVTVGIIALGAHWVVESSARMAARLGVSELVIGLTVVAFGTSAPEFAVTLLAAFRNQGDISVGNIVGSNIFNLGFILGGCAMIRAIPTSKALVKRDGVVIAISTLLVLAVVGWDLRLDRYDGGALFLMLIVYLAVLFKQRKEHPDEGPEAEFHLDTEHPKSLGLDVVELVGGLTAIIVGSHLLVISATELARGFGVSEWVIAVTIVAAGTSAPELATSLAGVIKNRYGISAGNIIGSDIFNLLGVLGLAGLLRPVEVDAMARVSLAALSGTVMVVLLFMRSGWRLSRLEGFALVAIAAVRWIFDFSTRSGGP